MRKVSLAAVQQRLQLELLVEIILPLLRQVPRTQNQTTLEIPPYDELLEEEPGHDGLAGAGVVREKEAERLARGHLPIDGSYLVGQRFDGRSVDGQEGVKEVGQPYAVGFRGQPEEVAVSLEAPGTSAFLKFSQCRSPRSRSLVSGNQVTMLQPVADRRQTSGFSAHSMQH